MTRTGVIYDPHPLWLEAIRSVVTRAGVEVAAASASIEQALDLVEAHQPEVFVTEIVSESGQLHGRALVERACELAPQTKTVVVSTREDAVSIEAALRGGAAAYLVKTAQADDVAAAVRQVFDRSLYLPSSGPSHPLLGQAPLQRPILTRRESEILRAVADGNTNAQVGRLFWVTEQTVKFHLANIYRKLEVSNRTEAARWAHLHGLLSAPAETGQLTKTA